MAQENMNENSESKGEETADGVQAAATSIDIPDQLGYSDDHVWVEDLDGLFALGITEYGAEQMGDLVFLDLPQVGDRVEAGDELVEMESAKAVQPMIAPMAGTVRYVNAAVADDPELVNHDPYGEGWIVKLEPDDDQPELLDGDQYARLINKLG